MYGSGLERIVDALFAAGEDGERLAVSLAEDPLVATLLLIHDLHPVPLEERVQAALDSVRPYMESHGGNVELLSLSDGVARIHLQGSCSDCSASVGDARAGDQAGARGGGARPRRARGRGRRAADDGRRRPADGDRLGADRDGAPDRDVRLVRGASPRRRRHGSRCERSASCATADGRRPRSPAASC